MTDRPLDLFLMAGQSNMAGAGVTANDLRPRWRKPIGSSEIWVKNQWQPLKVGAGYQRVGFGPELSFANTWEELTGRPCRIVKVARHGASLHTDWTADEDGGRLFNVLITRARAAMATDPMQLRGLLWMQGETDAMDEDAAQAYSARYERFIERLRNSLGAPDLPVVSGLISPPAEQFPYAQTVRQALAQTKSNENCSTVECAPLGWQEKDPLHLSGRGLSQLGRHFAKAANRLNEERAIPAPFQQWLWNSPRYQVWYEGPSPRPHQAVVTFPHATTENGFEERAFGQTYFRKRNIPAIYLRCRQSTWFQDDEIFDVADKIRAFVGSECALVTYGASMGAHGALLLSGRLKPKRVLAVAPQYSIDRHVVPWEKRWKVLARRIGRFHHNLADHISPSAEKIVLFDPLNEDKQQIDLLPKDPSWRFLQLPLASHQTLQRLLDGKSLPLLLENLFDEGPNLANLQQVLRRNRQHSKVYWLAMARKSMQNRPQLAAFAIDRCIEAGGPKRKLKRMKSELDLPENR